jgi:hypothetical protein
MLKSTRLSDIEILSLQNYSIAVRGHARTCSARRSKPADTRSLVTCSRHPVKRLRTPCRTGPSELPLEGGDVWTVTSFFGEVGHPTSKRLLVSNDFQAYSKTNKRAPLTRLAPPRDNGWRRSDIMSAHHLRHDRAAPKTRDAPKALRRSVRWVVASTTSQGAGAVQSIRAPAAGC